MTRRPHPRRWKAATMVLAAAAAVLAGAAPPARAQEGPVEIGQKPATDWLTLTPTTGSVEFLYRGQNDEIKPANAPTQKFTENRFEETLSLAGVGSIYHPNLVDLNLAGKFGLFQDELEVPGASDQQNGTIYEWDLNATLLRKEDIVPTLYSRRTTQIISRTFGPSLDDTLTTTGAVLDIRKKMFPTRLEAYHLTDDQTSLQSSEDFHLTQDTFTWHTEHRPTETQVFTWDYTYNNVTQSSGPFNTAFQTNDATLSHSVDFGDKRQNNLSSSVHYYEQSGDFAVQQFHWDELLRLRHTDNFETRYQYIFDDQNFSGTDQTTNRGVVGFTHRLYKSLVTTGNVGVQDLSRSAGGGDSREYFADLDLTYTKQVPLGTLTLNAAGAYNHEDNTAITVPTAVFDQPQTFSNGLPIVLVGNNINAKSIVITDPSGLLIYVPGQDYTVSATGTHVDINRILGGRLAPGQTVLVDYVLEPQAAYTADTTYFSFGGRYDVQQGALRGLGVYAHYAQQDQSIGGANQASITPNSFTDVLVGADYTVWLLTFGAERQWHDSTIVPFDATRFWARFATRTSPDTQVSINTAYNIIDYRDDGNRVTLLTLSAQVQHRFNARLWGSATILWQDETDQLQGDTQGLEEQLELQWHLRQIYAYALVRNSNTTSNFQDNTFQFFELGLRRQF